MVSLQLDESTDFQNNSILLAYARHINHDESDMHEGILRVSELPTHTNSSEIFKVLNGFIEEKSLEWKNCFGVCTDGAACLISRNSGLVTKIKDMAGNNLLSKHCYIHRQNLASKKMATELNEALSQSVKIIYVFTSYMSVQNVFLRCPTLTLHCFLSSQWPSFRFLSFMAFFIHSNQFFFGLPRALFCFGIDVNPILGNLPSAILWTRPHHVSWFCSVSFIIVSSSPICCLIVTFLILTLLDILQDLFRASISVASNRLLLFSVSLHVSAPHNKLLLINAL